MKKTIILIALIAVFLGTFALLETAALACGGEDCDEVNTEGYAWINTDQYQEWLNETIGDNDATTYGSGTQIIEAYGQGNDITTVEFEGNTTQYQPYDVTVEVPLGEINHTGESIMGAYVNAASSPDCQEISADVTNYSDFSTSTEMTGTTMQSSACAYASLNLSIEGAPETVNYDVINEQVHNYSITRTDGAYQTGFTRTLISASNLTP